MIKKPEEMDFSNHKIAMILAGVAGIGKTTLALSAPKPLLIDLDNGVSRVEARHRTDTMTCTSFEELKQELANEDLRAYETIVLDTGGKLFEFMKPAIIKENAKYGKSDGSLSLQGYGIAKKRYSEFVNSIKKLGKNLVIVFHATEVTLDATEQLTGLRIRIEGGTKDEIWDDMDLGCFMEMKGNKRTVGFSNCERYYAKGTHGVHGVYQIPNLDEKEVKNTFLSDLFKKVNDDLNEESKEAIAYKKCIEVGLDAISECKNPDSLNKVLSTIANMEHHLTSESELKHALMAKAKELKSVYDKQAKAFTNEQPA